MASSKKPSEEIPILLILEKFLAYFLERHHTRAIEDPKIWIGIILALSGFSLLIYLVRNGEAVRKDGYSYNDEIFLLRAQYGFILWRWGYNLYALGAVQYYLDYTGWFYGTLMVPVFIICFEKIWFMFSMNENNWIDKHYFKDDVEGQVATSRNIKIASIYERFEVTNTFKLILVSSLQGFLLLFYTAALQVAVLNSTTNYIHLFWIVSFLVQAVSDMIGVFGQNFSFVYWAFMVSNAGRVSVENEAQRVKVTPRAIAIYTHFLLAVFFEMFGRSLLILTLPLFLMASDNPMEYMLNCIATGFFISISKFSTGLYKITLAEDVSERDEFDARAGLTAPVQGKMDALHMTLDEYMKNRVNNLKEQTQEVNSFINKYKGILPAANMNKFDEVGWMIAGKGSHRELEVERDVQSATSNIEKLRLEKNVYVRTCDMMLENIFSTESGKWYKDDLKKFFDDDVINQCSQIVLHICVLKVLQNPSQHPMMSASLDNVLLFAQDKLQVKLDCLPARTLQQIDALSKVGKGGGKGSRGGGGGRASRMGAEASSGRRKRSRKLAQ